MDEYKLKQVLEDYADPRATLNMAFLRTAVVK